MNDEDLSRLLREHATRHPADDALQAKVRTQIALQSAAAEPMPAPSRRRLVFAGAALAMVGVVAGVTATLSLQTWQAAQPGVADEVVVAHVRALQVGPLFEVASSDRHQVKPWFQGRLDYTPPVPDAVPGFTMLGGRTQPLQGKPTAVLAFQLRLHKIDLFIRPAEREAAPMRVQRRGFNVVHWSDRTMQYWAVSDLDGAELDQFGAAWRNVVAAN